jgi:hypothetical protein
MMKIALIGPGILDIPPTGWGAVESIIWECANELTNLGYEGIILNTPDKSEIISTIKEEQFDFIHIHYDVFYDLIPIIKKVSSNSKIALSSHYPYIDQFEKHTFDGYNKVFDWMINNQNLFYNFCVSQKDLNVFTKKTSELENLYLFKTGAQHKNIRFSLNPNLSNRTICIGKIDNRKMQYFYQSIDSIDFVGPIGDVSKFDLSKNYLGEWTKKEVYDKMTEYGNMILLSRGENGTPLVIKEALMSGLGIVTSEYCAYELDLDLPFIDVIPTNKLSNLDYIAKVVDRNKKISLSMRKDIVNYGINNFSWENLIKIYSQNIKNLK